MSQLKARVADAADSIVVAPEFATERLGAIGAPINDPDDVEIDESQLATYAVGFVPVHMAILRVMADLRAIDKTQQYDAAGTKYKYRGIDQIVIKIKPLLVRHALLVLPELLSYEGRDIVRASGGRSHEATVTMRYTLVGPGGDTLSVSAAGMAMDTSDKSVSKAQSVAWRNALIQTFVIPTRDEDPDASRLERGDAPAPKPGVYVEEICDPATPLRRLYQIKTELATHNLSNTVVTNEVGDDETLGSLLSRIGNARRSVDA